MRSESWHGEKRPDEHSLYVSMASGAALPVHEPDVLAQLTLGWEHLVSSAQGTRVCDQGFRIRVTPAIVLEMIFE